jgi:hypothetical protein
MAVSMEGQDHMLTYTKCGTKTTDKDPRACVGNTGADPVIEITRLGDNPLFGFSKPVRNGDYTNAVVGPNNTFIVGAQFATSKIYTTSSGYRQNWGEALPLCSIPHRLPPFFPPPALPLSLSLSLSPSLPLSLSPSLSVTSEEGMHTLASTPVL